MRQTSSQEDKIDSHFDITLGERLGSSNGNSAPPFNDAFSEFYDYVRDNVEHIRDDENYDTGEPCRLLARCREHAGDLSKPLAAKKIIAFTHPLYLHLSQMGELGEEGLKQAEEYLDRLMMLLEANIPKDVANKVLLDTPHHYAAATSLLLKRGMFDAAFFTEYDKGFLLEQKDMKNFRNKSLVMGGEYANGCLPQSIIDVAKHGGVNSIRVMKGLCLRNPKNYPTDIFCNSVWGGMTIGEAELVSLRDLGNELGVPFDY